jgi:hypothetical protein
MRHRILCVTVTLVLALGTAVLADPPTVSIQPQATLDQLTDPVFGGPPINIGVQVTVVVDCGDPNPTEFELNVGVRQGDVTAESGGVHFPSSGGKQVVMVDVFGPFNPGDGVASATLACGGTPLPLLEGLELGQRINITAP